MRTFDVICRDDRVVAVLDSEDGSVRAAHGTGVLPAGFTPSKRDVRVSGVQARNAIVALNISPSTLGVVTPKPKPALPPTIDEIRDRLNRHVRVMGRKHLDRRAVKAVAAANPSRVTRRLP